MYLGNDYRKGTPYDSILGPIEAHPLCPKVPDKPLSPNINKHFLLSVPHVFFNAT